MLIYKVFLSCIHWIFIAKSCRIYGFGFCFFIFLLCFYGPNHLDHSIAKPSTCQPIDTWKKQRVFRFIKETKKRSQLRSVENYFSKIRFWSKKHCLSLAELSLTENMIKKYTEIGNKSEIKYWKERAEVESIFSRVDRELSMYKGVSKKMGVDVESSEFKEEIRKIRKRGLASEDLERKKCTQVDNRNDILGEVRDQDSMGWCYAYAAADLITYKYGQRVSAVDVALKHNDPQSYDDPKSHDDQDVDDDLFLDTEEKESEIEGGLVEMGVKIPLQRGVCLESDVPSDDYKDVELLGILQNAESLQHDFLNTVYKNREEIRKDICSRFSSILSLFPQLNINDIVEILEKSSRTNFIDNLRNKGCKSRVVKDKNVKLVAKAANNYNEKLLLFSEIDKQLESKNVVSATLVGELLVDRDTVSSNINHAMLVVGRRFNSQTKHCEYLLRNSWGKSCSYYDHFCDKGHLWISKADLNRNIYKITYIEDSPPNSLNE